MDEIKNIIILGGHGDGVVVASLVHDIEAFDNSVKLFGFLNDGIEEKILQYPVLGKLKDWKKFKTDDSVYFVTALLKTKYSYQRSKLIDSLCIPREKFCNVVHPTATISKLSTIGVGNVIGPSVNIMPNVYIGDHCSFRAGASIGHDCIIEDFCYVGPNAVMAGRSKMRKGAHMGPNSSLLDGKVLQEHVVLGMGSVMTKDTEEFRVYFGVPAKKIGMSFKDG